MGKDLTLVIPGEVLDALRLPPDEVEKEFLQELAVALYRRNVLPLGKTQALARMTRWEFEELLGQRRVPRHYTELDLEEDVGYARSHQ